VAWKSKNQSTTQNPERNSTIFAAGIGIRAAIVLVLAHARTFQVLKGTTSQLAEQSIMALATGLSFSSLIRFAQKAKRG
jgi:hypothetical protein